MGTSASRLSRKMSPTKLFLLLFAFATEVQPEPTLNPESRISQYGHTVRNRPTVSGGHLQYRLALCTKGGSLVGWHAGGTCTLVKGKFLSISEPSTSVEAIKEDSEGAVRIARGHQHFLRDRSAASRMARSRALEHPMEFRLRSRAQSHSVRENSTERALMTAFSLQFDRLRRDIGRCTSLGASRMKSP
jgi:hypothetical protein